MLLSALMVGILLIKLDRLGAAVVSGWGGFTAGVLLNEAWLYMYQYSNLSLYILGILTLVCFSLGFIWCHEAMIASTSFFGAYFTIRGISVYIGYFPGEITLFKNLLSGQQQSVDGQFYYYLGAIIVLTLGSSVAQVFINRKTTQKFSEVSNITI